MTISGLFNLNFLGAPSPSICCKKGTPARRPTRTTVTLVSRVASGVWPLAPGDDVLGSFRSSPCYFRPNNNAMRLTVPTVPSSFRVVLAHRLVQFAEKLGQRGLDAVPIRNERLAERVFEKRLRRDANAFDKRRGRHFLIMPIKGQPVDGRIRRVLSQRVLGLAHVSAEQCVEQAA